MKDEMYCSCGVLMNPVYGIVATDDELDETYEGLAGYECPECGFEMDINGKEIG